MIVDQWDVVRTTAGRRVWCGAEVQGLRGSWQREGDAAEKVARVEEAGLACSGGRLGGPG